MSQYPNDPIYLSALDYIKANHADSLRHTKSVAKDAISRNGLCYFSEKNSLNLIEIGCDKTIILQNVGTNFRSTNKLLVKVHDHPSHKVLIFFVKTFLCERFEETKQCADKAFLCLSINQSSAF